MVTKLITYISVVLVLFSVFYFAHIFKAIGLHISVVPYCGFMLALLLMIVFLIYPMRKGIPKIKLPWHDYIFMIMGLCGGGYIAFFTKWWGRSIEIGQATTVEILLCFMTIISILEAARRTMGKTLPLVALFFILHLTFGSYFPGFLTVPQFSLGRITTAFYLNPDGLFGTPLVVAFTIILIFMLFASFLQNSGAGEFITNGAFALSGRWTGGPAKAAVLASCALGTLTGSGPANVAATGSFTIPLMKRVGYKPEFAAAVEAVSSNGGSIMPPVMAVVAFIMAEQLGIQYWSVCKAALLPAILYYIAVLTQVHFEAAKLDLQGLPKEQLPSIKKVMRRGWFYLLPVVALIYFLAVINLPPQHSGLYATLILIMIIIANWQIKKIRRKGAKELISWLVDSIEAGVKQLIIPAVACATAGIIIGSITASGFGFRLSSVIVDLAGGNTLMLLVITAIASFILGMGMTSIPCYLILAILVAPALVQLGMMPIAAHFFVLYFGILSFITPPVAITSFVAAGIAEADPTKTGFQAMRLAIVAYIVPFIFVYHPELLLIGTLKEVIVAIITSITGVVFLGSAVEGYLLKKLNWLERIFLIAGALFLIWPGIGTDIPGIIVIGLVLLRHIRASKKVSFHIY